MKKIAIIVLNYKSTTETIECVQSLQGISHAKFEFSVIVVDNSPSESGTKLADLKKKNVEILNSKTNAGFAGGNNIGISHALASDFDFMLVLNNDTVVQKDFLEKLLTVYKTKKDVGIVVPKIYFAKGHEYHKDNYKKDELGKVIWYAGGQIDWKNILTSHRGVDEVDKGQFDEIEETEYATGACMLLSRKLVENVGMFDEDYFLYFEDCDLSMRAKEKGCGIYFQPKSVVWHKNAASSGGSGSGLQDYYTTRNRLLFGKKYASLRAKIALHKEAASLLIQGREYQKKGVKDYVKGNFGKAEFEIT